MKTKVLFLLATCASLGICLAELRMGKHETIASIHLMKGVRATLDPVKDEPGAVEVSIEIEPKNEFLKSPAAATYVLTLVNAKGELVVNLPANGFKELHKSPVVHRGYYRLEFMVKKSLLDTSHLIFYDEDETFTPTRTTIRYVHFTAIPENPPGRPVLAEKEKAQSWTFEAEVVRVQLMSRFAGTVKVAAIDPRFVAELRLTADVADFGKKGTTIAIAISSPTRDLRLPDYKNAEGEVLRLKMSKEAGAKRFSLRRLFPKKEKE